MKTEETTIQVGSRVRNVKTRMVGEIESISGDDAQVHVFGNESGIAGPGYYSARIKDLELLNVKEFELVKNLVEARRKKAEYGKMLDEAKSEAARLEDEMIEYMRTHDIQSTAPYDAFGKVEIDGMKVMPNITEENRDAAFEALRAMGRGEVIKEQIHPATLASLVSELIDNGTPVPPTISYFLKPKLSFKKK